MNSTYKIGFYTAISLVIANMIGTGVFTSLGFQLFDIHSVFSILVLWLLGGIISFCGALVYGELGVAIPRSGGEYVYLSKLIHPSIGFMSGWVSSTVGFAAPVALASMALGTYVIKLYQKLILQLVL
jgi:APA family basic amino acid/polyamine antiporter